MLFQWDLNHQETWRVQSQFWKNVPSEKNTRVFANALFEGAASEVEALDKLLEQHATNWRLDRMAAIDRNILRLAAHELRKGETPAKVVINEAVELAKKFSDEDSPSFINGVLDAVRKALN
jgi:N utilization substance protein B